MEEIELCEKDGTGKIKINGKEINNLTSYAIKRGTDMVDVTITISIPTSNFKTKEF